MILRSVLTKVLPSPSGLRLGAKEKLEDADQGLRLMPVRVVVKAVSVLDGQGSQVRILDGSCGVWWKD
jgi:hypothetical protein